MKVVVVTSDVPFVTGGHRIIAEALVSQLNAYGHDAILWCTPQNRFGRQFSAYLANYFTDLGETGSGDKIDAVISLRYPSYAVKHYFHICWLNHRAREYYDLWEQFKSKISFANKIKESIRRTAIHWIDRYFLKNNVKKLYAQSINIQKRLQKWGKIKSEVLYPPAIPRNYCFKEYGDFIFVPARLHPLKRISLGIDALAKMKNTNISMIIVGEGPEYNNLIALIKECNLEKRVQLLGWVAEDTLLDLYARCLAVFYGPLNEDYGLVTLEAFSSRKALITCQDSGGTNELLEHGKSGFLVNSEPDHIALAFDAVSDKLIAEKQGNYAYSKSAEFSWEKTIATLLQLKTSNE
ncbi:MAG: hypothetical protein A2Y62_15895 [Candidatus Fischerbacteria bacterium RBG_13_37_8]|uniref:Glycosyl transferase family 1 domain-containing protein n=1 Tax=Candidatus Fischerbacteria bacterium RBG_13_37_8 TaxID=1817863 RepID=A0A1F5VST4_9BACT|nr:MAG: hypothetical protein A2Y62_15895 [Candidatus Fischerbacteria bacterium RBG_13_37_8]